MNTPLTFREISVGSPDYEAALRLRAEVLRRPLGLEFTAEEIAREPHCLHLAAFAESDLVGTLLLQPLDAQTVQMRQVAIRPNLQGQGIGAALVRFSEAFARERGFTRIIAHARGTAVEFYRHLGYATEGAPFLECTIPHVAISKTIA